MKTFPALILSTVLVVGTPIAIVVLVDALLPAQVIQTTASHATFLPDHAVRVHFVLPLTAGEMASCQASREQLRALRPAMPIVVRRSPLLGRCLDVLPQVSRETAGRPLPPTPAP